VLSDLLLFAAVRRWFGPTAGLIAGAVLALTPAAALIFRFNNPDALLVLLMTAAGYAVQRAIERDRTRWLVLAGVLLGFAFLTKMMQAFLVLPGFALVYLIAAPTGVGKRIRDLLVAGAALAVSAGWFVLLVSLWPASSRPYIAGSTNNSLWQLAIGYNGLGRILGGEGNGGGGGRAGGGGGGGGGGFGGSTGIGRMFGSSFGLEISWLLPAALIALVALLVGTWSRPRTDRTRAAAVLWGGWVVVTGLTFSYMSGTIHPYYTVELAPAIRHANHIAGRDALPLSRFRRNPECVLPGHLALGLGHLLQPSVVRHRAIAYRRIRPKNNFEAGRRGGGSIPSRSAAVRRMLEKSVTSAWHRVQAGRCASNAASRVSAGRSAALAPST